MAHYYVINFCCTVVASLAAFFSLFLSYFNFPFKTMYFKVYRSSAGSGKTFTLTKEYLKLALMVGSPKHAFYPLYFKSILAITFTKMAANEMKTRILGQLKKIATLPEGQTEPMLDLMRAEAAHDFPNRPPISESEICRRAALVHRTILHNYNYFSVSTIDAFHNRIVQAFTQDIGLPYHYRMEQSTEELLEEVIEDLQSQIQKDTDGTLSGAFRQIIFKNIEEGKNLFFADELKKFLAILQNENARPYLEKAQKYTLGEWGNIYDQLRSYIKKTEKEIQKLAAEAMQYIENQGLKKSDFYGRGAIFAYFDYAARLDGAFFKNPFKNAYKTIEDDKWAASKIPEATKEKLADCAPFLKKKFLLLDAYRKGKCLSDIILAKELHKRSLYIALLRTAKINLEALKFERGIAFFSDLTFKINEIIEHEPVPYIYERIGEQYDHLLIDEFQDTSKMQWHNLLPLILNALSKKNVNVIVGDTKQSIYRWRGGLANMLADLPEVPTLSEKSPRIHEINLFKAYQKSETLTTNRRSSRHIISFNNALFSHILDTAGEQYPKLRQFYDEVRQETYKKDSGKVSLELIETSDKKNYQAATLQRLIEKIEQLRQDGNSYGDIAILVRENKSAPPIAQTLLEAQIPLVSNDSLLLAHAAGVCFLVGFMKLLVGLSAPEEKMELLSFLCRQQTENNAATLSSKQLFDFAEEIAHPDPQKTLELIEKNFAYSIETDKWTFFSLYDLAEHIAQTFGLWENEAEIIYLQKTLDLVRKHTQSEGNQIKRFLKKWEQNADKYTLDLPEQDEAVKIITIHKSKGLEFPVVILPFADWELNIRHNEKNLLWADWKQQITAADFVAFPAKKEILNTELAQIYIQEQELTFIDAVNILYVATTRPAQELYILGLKPKNAAAANTINGLLFGFAEAQASGTDKGLLALDDKKMATYRYNFGDLPAQDTEKPSCKHRSNTAEYYLSIPKRSTLRTFPMVCDTDKKHKTSISDLRAPREKGILLHQLFEKIRYCEDVKTAVEAAVCAGELPASEKENMRKSIEKVINLPEIKPLFVRAKGRKVLNERALCALGKVVRPDRIVIEDDKITLLEYKTGKFEKSHEAQLKAYAHILRQIGYTKIEAFLVFTAIPKVVGIEP